MIFAFALLGLLLGWLVNAASEYLPRFATKPPSGLSARVPGLALLQFLPGHRSAAPYFRLHLGIELLSAAFLAGLGVTRSFNVAWGLLVFSFLVFLLIAVIDLKYRLILNIVTYPAIVVVLLVQLLILQQDVRVILVGGLLAFSIFFLVSYLKPGQLGGGDVKLAALIGLTFGFPQVLLALLVGAGVGAVAAGVLLARRAGLDYRIPYAPFLCFGAMITLLL